MQKMESLKTLRKQRELTQEECARFLNMSRRAYQLLEAESGRQKSAKYQRCYNLLKDAEVVEQRKTLFKTHVFLGEDLFPLRDSVAELPKRHPFHDLHDFIEGQSTGKVCILYGLRHSGKTTMLFQLLSELDLEKSAYIQLNETFVMGDLIKDLNALKAKGVRYVLIDEITLLPDFIPSCGVLSDIYAKLGMKIVLSGADSLGFALANMDALYNRGVLIHASHIPYGEYREMSGEKGVDEYIQSPFNADDDQAKAAKRFIDAAIITNIQRTLRNCHNLDRYPRLRALQEKNALVTAIHGYLEELNHRFLLCIVEGKSEPSELGLARTLSLQEEEVKEIQECLRALDVLSPTTTVYEDGSKKQRDVFLQPGLRFAITKGLVYDLLNDASFASFTEKQKSAIGDNLIKQIKQRMLREVVLLETSMAQNEDKVFRYHFASGEEFDMLIAEKDDEFALFEIKRGKKAATNHLRDKPLLDAISSRFGECKSRTVLYRGENQKDDGILYQNVEEYLSSLYQSKK